MSVKTQLEQHTGPLDGALVVAVSAYLGTYYGLKWLHHRILTNAVIAEAEWLRVSSASGPFGI